MSRTAETVELGSVPAEEVPRKGDSRAGPEQTQRKGHRDEGESPQLRLRDDRASPRDGARASLDVFTLIDHSPAAEQVGLTMQESELLISNTDAPHQGEPKDDLWSAQKELHEEERPEC